MKTPHEVHRAPRSVYRTSPAPARGPQFWGACPPFDAAGAVGGVQLSGPQRIVAAIRRRSGALLIAEMLDPVERAPMVRVPFVRGVVNFLRYFRRSSFDAAHGVRAGANPIRLLKYERRGPQGRKGRKDSA